MTADEHSVDRDTMIATLEELGQTYMKHNNFQDAEHVFGIVLRTGRDKFADSCVFHRTMFKASVVMQKLKINEGDNNAAIKYSELADYHQNAAVDAIKLENICDKVPIDMGEHSLLNVDLEPNPEVDPEDESEFDPKQEFESESDTGTERDPEVESEFDPEHEFEFESESDAGTEREIDSDSVNSFTQTLSPSSFASESSEISEIDLHLHTLSFE